MQQGRKPLGPSLREGASEGERFELKPMASGLRAALHVYVWVKTERGCSEYVPAAARSRLHFQSPNPLWNYNPNTQTTGTIEPSESEDPQRSKTKKKSSSLPALQGLR